MVLRAAAAWAAGLLAPAASARAVRAPGAASQSLNPVDREFLRRATAFGATEHALARIAVRQGRSERVRDFARRLLADHDALHVALRRIAAGRRLAATKVADAATLRRLRALKGAAFDREYMARMYRDRLPDAADPARAPEARAAGRWRVARRRDHARRRPLSAGHIGCRFSAPRTPQRELP